MTDCGPTFASVYDGRLSQFVDARLAAAERARPVDVRDTWTAVPGAGPDRHHMLVSDGTRTVARAHPNVAVHITSHSPGRAARQIAAHRRILARFNRVAEELDQHDPPVVAGTISGDLLMNRKACALALADVACTWSDHPDFQAEWQHFAALDDLAPSTVLVYVDAVADEDTVTAIIHHQAASSARAGDTLTIAYSRAQVTGV